MRKVSRTREPKLKGVLVMKKELDLNGKIRNLQVSISIARREDKDIRELLADKEQPLPEDKKMLKLARLERIAQIIETKTAELAPLQAEKAATKPVKEVVVAPPADVPKKAKKAKAEVAVEATEEF